MGYFVKPWAISLCFLTFPLLFLFIIFLFYLLFSTFPSSSCFIFGLELILLQWNSKAKGQFLPEKLWIWMAKSHCEVKDLNLRKPWTCFFHFSFYLMFFLTFPLLFLLLIILFPFFVFFLFFIFPSRSCFIFGLELILLQWNSKAKGQFFVKNQFLPENLWIWMAKSHCEVKDLNSRKPSSFWTKVRDQQKP